MRTMNKWDYANHEYVPHRVPTEWKVSLREDDMDTIVNCASCGKGLPYGETYTSIEIHTDGMGFGYAVCDECYGKEVKRRLQADKLAHYEDLEEAGRLIEVTRCRNCTRHENSSSTEGFGWCDEYECITADDGYCSRAVDKLAELKGGE